MDRLIPDRKIDIELGKTYAVFSYKNYRNEISQRQVVLSSLWFGKSNPEYYPEEQWFIDALDLDKQAFRTFALKNIQFE